MDRAGRMDRFVLDAYAARSCPVKVHNQFDPTVERPAPVQDESLYEVFAGGKDFEDRVLDAVLAANADRVVDLRPLMGSDWDTQEAATRAAVARGHPIIIKGILPLDLAGYRSGRPDLLLRGPDRHDGSPGYVPAEVKRHRMLERSGPSPDRPQFASSLERPLPGEAVELPALAVRRSREPDLLQMGHYWRLLEAAGFSAGGEPLAGVIGTDRPPGAAAEVVAWIGLTDKIIRTFARTAADGWKRRSPLERYDHEHSFRVKVAHVAARRAQDSAAAPMVQPIKIPECDRCAWWSVCGPQLGQQDLSLRISKSPLDVREISVLRGFGIASITDLAGADLEALLPDYLPEVQHRVGAEGRLRTAYRRARLMSAGIDLERITDQPIELPGHELEIDLDIETSADDRVYLWGFLVDDRAGAGPPSYHSFARFEDLTSHGESALARQAMTWLLQLTEGRDAAVYHYSDFEVVHVGKLADRSGDPRIARGADRIRRLGVDMFGHVRAHFFGAHGLGLKVVAHAGAGFSWRDDDPGGLNSQRWFDDAVHLPDPADRQAAAQRVLKYNEDDVRATHALRAWLRTDPGDSEPATDAAVDAEDALGAVDPDMDDLDTDGDR